MSTRASIALAGPIHIYEETNDNFEICISELQGPISPYNGDITMTRSELKDLYDQLTEFYNKQENK